MIPWASVHGLLLLIKWLLQLRLGVAFEVTGMNARLPWTCAARCRLNASCGVERAWLYWGMEFLSRGWVTQDLLFLREQLLTSRSQRREGVEKVTVDLGYDLQVAACPPSSN